jgi:Flp pilus assembly protein TadG
MLNDFTDTTRPRRGRMALVRPYTKPLKNSERGNAMIEFAISWVVIWLAFAGVYQFGYSFYVYNAIQTAVSDAAQLGAKMNYDTSSPSTFTNSVTNMVVYGDTTASQNAKPIVLGLTTDNVSVSVNPSSAMPTDITVSIKNFQVDALFTKFTFDGKPRATAAYQGHVTCSGC